MEKKKGIKEEEEEFFYLPRHYERFLRDTPIWNAFLKKAPPDAPFSAGRLKYGEKS